MIVLLVLDPKEEKSLPAGSFIVLVHVKQSDEG